MKDFILCIGLSCVDVLLRGLEQINEHKEQIPVDNVTLWVGGDAMNEAVILNKLGNSVRLMTGLGDDTVADFIELFAKKDGIDMKPSVRKKGSSTSVAIPIVYKNAERSIISKGLSDSLSFYMNPDEVKGARIVSLASLFCPPFTDVENTLEIVQRAKAEGAIVCADMMCMDISICNVETYRKVWPYIDYFFLNEDEARILTGSDELQDMASMILDAGVKNVLIKIGKRGCLAQNKEEKIIVSPYLVNAVDTTGAGDNFAAGFITGLMEKKSLYECCQYANAAASIAVQYDGASTGIKSRQQLYDRINGN